MHARRSLWPFARVPTNRQSVRLEVELQTGAICTGNARWYSIGYRARSNSLREDLNLIVGESEELGQHAVQHAGVQIGHVSVVAERCCVESFGTVD